MKILALLPTYKVMDITAVQSLCSLQADIYRDGNNINTIFVNGFNAAKARTKLMEYSAKKKDVDYVVNIDSDQVYTSEDLYALIDKMEEHDLDMLSAGYLIKDQTMLFCHGSFAEDGSFSKISSVGATGIIDCDVLGFGFLVMRNSFVRKMVETYGDDLFLFDIKDNSTEDVYFCRQAKKMGTRICFDADTRVGHLMLVDHR